VTEFYADRIEAMYKDNNFINERNIQSIKELFLLN